MTDDPQRWLTPEMKALVAWVREQGRHPESGPARLWPLRNEDRVGHWLERAYHAHAALLRSALAELGVCPRRKRRCCWIFGRAPGGGATATWRGGCG